MKPINPAYYGDIYLDELAKTARADILESFDADESAAKIDAVNRAVKRFRKALRRPGEFSREVLDCRAHLADCVRDTIMDWAEEAQAAEEIERRLSSATSQTERLTVRIPEFGDDVVEFWEGAVGRTIRFIGRNWTVKGWKVDEKHDTGDVLVKLVANND